MDTKLQYPIILIHGWTDKPAESGTWKVVERSLTKNQIHFFVPGIARYGSIKERVEKLVQEISSLYPAGQPVHLVGHSLGGIVARAIAGREGLSFQVLTVTTLGTPNRGLRYLDRLPVLDGDSEDAASIRSIFGTDFGGLTNLSCKYMTEFNRTTPNNPSVRYFSWAGEIVLPSITYAPHWLIVGRFYKHSDGIVGVETAEWDEDLGAGTHLGTVRGLTHSSIVCLEVFEKTLPHLYAAEHGRSATVESISGGFRDQIHRRIDGHKDAFKGRVYAFKDRGRHNSIDEAGKKNAYLFSERGYEYK